MKKDEKKYHLHLGKSEEVLKTLPENSVDSVVTDPPYHLTSIVKRFGKEGSSPNKYGTDGAFSRFSKGFMGKEWDGGDIAFRPEFWAEVLRVLKPGGHLLAFSGSRTYHRMACGIEDAGFEIRDQIMWLYGSGFPKSHNVAVAIDKQTGIAPRSKAFNMKGKGDRAEELETNGREFLPPYEAITDAAKQWKGWGSALKPAHEPIVLARKPLIGTIAENVLKYGTGAINIDGCRVPTSGADAEKHRAEWDRMQSVGAENSVAMNSGLKPIDLKDYAKDGRWPANVIHDGSDEVVNSFPIENGSSVSRFFYCAKASKEDRDEGLDALPEVITDILAGHRSRRMEEIKRPDGKEPSHGRNTHPTVKPTALMRYLVRMITPKGGVTLDPFMGSGSTGKAAMIEGVRFIGIDMTEEYFKIATARIEHAANPNYVPEVELEKGGAVQTSLFV